MRSLETWGELLDVLLQEGYGEDEYLSGYAGYLSHGSDRNWRLAPLWERETKWIACYWVEGDSEGYYVHIDKLSADPSARGSDFHYLSQRMILGKFWYWERAAQCVARAQVLVNRGA